jgi:hypothetical protein
MEANQSVKWISTKDELPEKGRWVLIVSWRGIIQASFWNDYWQMQELSTLGQKFKLEEVTHWMYLPVPPKSYERTIGQFLSESEAGEYRVVINRDRSAYIHPLGRDGETFDFKAWK